MAGDCDSLIVYADGASRGNPGPASFGAVVFDKNGNEMNRVGEQIGRATNNVAEYRGAIAGLELALALGARSVELRLDSELVVRQLQGRYRVRNPDLKKLFVQAKDLQRQFSAFRALSIPREKNQLADQIANQAFDS